MIRRHRWACVLSSLVALSACRTAQNYLDPTGPVYRAAYAGERQRGPILRVVTFNVEYALRVDKAIEALRDHEQLRGADLIFLQEMDAPGVDRIAQALRLNAVYYPASLHPKHLRDVGNAILTPWPLESTFKLPLPHTSRGLRQARAAVGAVVVVGALRLRAFSLHLGSPFGASPGQRRDQVDVVLSSARADPLPTIVAGDFNSSKLGNRLVADGYSWPTRKVGPTTRGQSFDHVFVKGMNASVLQTGVAQDVTEASDHRPVFVDFRLGPEETP